MLLFSVSLLLNRFERSLFCPYIRAYVCAVWLELAASSSLCGVHTDLDSFDNLEIGLDMICFSDKLLYKQVMTFNQSTERQRDDEGILLQSSESLIYINICIFIFICNCNEA